MTGRRRHGYGAAVTGVEILQIELLGGIEGNRPFWGSRLGNSGVIDVLRCLPMFWYVALSLQDNNLS